MKDGSIEEGSGQDRRREDFARTLEWGPIQWPAVHGGPLGLSAFMVILPAATEARIIALSWPRSHVTCNCNSPTDIGLKTPRTMVSRLLLPMHACSQRLHNPVEQQKIVSKNMVLTRSDTF